MKMMTCRIVKELGSSRRAIDRDTFNNKGLGNFSIEYLRKDDWRNRLITRTEIAL